MAASSRELGVRRVGESKEEEGEGRREKKKRENGKREKEKKKEKKRREREREKKREMRRRSRRRPQDWSSTRGGRLAVSALHGFGGEALCTQNKERKQRDWTVIGTDVGWRNSQRRPRGRGKEGERIAVDFECRTAKRWEVFWEIRSSNGNRFRNDLSSTTKKRFWKIIFLAGDLFGRIFGMLQTYPT
jgi:hypothetical protein